MVWGVMGPFQIFGTGPLAVLIRPRNVHCVSQQVSVIFKRARWSAKAESEAPGERRCHNFTKLTRLMQVINILTRPECG